MRILSHDEYTVIQNYRTAQSTEINVLLEVNLKATNETKPNKWKMASKK